MDGTDAPRRKPPMAPSLSPRACLYSGCWSASLQAPSSLERVWVCGQLGQVQAETPLASLWPRSVNLGCIPCGEKIDTDLGSQLDRPSTIREVHKPSGPCHRVKAGAEPLTEDL